MAPAAATAAAPAPWPAQKGATESVGAEYIQNVLEDPPTNARKVLQPLDETGEATAVEENSEDTAGSSESLKIAICDIMDMSATDHEGFEVVDGTKEVDMLQNNGMVFHL